MTSQEPIFLAGVDRTGIGLLGELLESHPNIAVTRRINYWSFYYNRYGDLSDLKNFERCLADMMNYTRIKRLQPLPDRLRSEFLKGQQTYSRLFALLQEYNMERLGKSRWADKSLNSERYAETIMTDFPTAKMIHILRDPRDRYASQLTHRGVGKGKIGAGTALWLWSVRLAENNARHYPDRYKVVKYETLVTEPESFLQEICDFIGEEYSPEMLMVEQPDQDGSAPNAAAKRVPRQMWSTSIGRFHQNLSEREVAFMQMLIREKMIQNGYQPEPQELSLSSKLAYYFVDCPVNLTRMLLAQSQANIRERAGRTPSDRRLAQAC